VGYGAQPDGCVELARDRCDLSLAGNHDLVVTGEIPITDFSSSAAAAARWTQETIGEDTMAFLKGLAPADAAREPALYHASPRDPVWEYVLSTWQADDSGKMSGATADAGSEHDLSAGRWLVNPGGVGQPRDGDPRAAWLLLDTGEWTATWRRVEYPIEEAARAIEEAGLPRVLAERLFSGQ
jgi:diadenosine tetraphosphatase ApaH/serine/threonine PP2A family protein phosphatase